MLAIKMLIERNGKKSKEIHLKLVSQVLSGLEPPLDLRTTIFGHKVVVKITFCPEFFCPENISKIFKVKFKMFQVSLPFFACPTAGNRMFHTEGELATAKVYNLSFFIQYIQKYHTNTQYHNTQYTIHNTQYHTIYTETQRQTMTDRYAQILKCICMHTLTQSHSI